MADDIDKEQFALDFLKGLTVFNLKENIQNEENAIALFQSFGILPFRDTIRNCYTCNQQMKTYKSAKSRLGWTYMCTNSVHKKIQESPMVNTWLEGIHIRFEPVYEIPTVSKNSESGGSFG